MAVRHVLNGINDTIQITFTGLAKPINLKFSRDDDSATITIPPSSFAVGSPMTLKSSPIPKQYIPSSPSMNWIIINGTTYTSCNITIDNSGIITLSNGPSGTNFQPAITYTTTSNQFIKYLI